MTIFSTSYTLFDILFERPGTKSLVNPWPRKKGVMISIPTKNVCSRRTVVPQRKVKMLLFIYFWPCLFFIAVHGLSLITVSRGYSSSQCLRFLSPWLLFLQSLGSRCVGFSSCNTQVRWLWHRGARMPAQQLGHTGLVAPWHVGSSWTRNQTCVPCMGRQILNHWTIREVPRYYL